MGSNRSSSREKKPDKRHIVIFVEGSVTEKEYFKAIVSRLHLSRDLIEVKTAPAKNIDKLIDHVSFVKADPSRHGITGEVDEWWVVVDTEGKACSKALKKARKEKINVAVSDPSIELWLLLHFQDALNWLVSRFGTSNQQNLVPPVSKFGTARKLDWYRLHRS